MEYVVIEAFTDMLDGDRTYTPGDRYPRLGVAVDEWRLNELAGNHNKLHRPLIKAVKPVAKAEKAEAPAPEPTPQKQGATKTPRKKAVK